MTQLFFFMVLIYIDLKYSTTKYSKNESGWSKMCMYCCIIALLVNLTSNSYTKMETNKLKRNQT